MPLIAEAKSEPCMSYNKDVLTISFHYSGSWNCVFFIIN